MNNLKPNKIPPSDEMLALIEEIYRTFKRYPVPPTFDICRRCCVSPEEEQALKSTPLKQLSYTVINSYCQSVNSGAQNSSEIRYLLPRLLELVTHEHYPGISEELALRRVGLANPTGWPPLEQEILARFARQFMVEEFKRAEAHEWLVLLDTHLIMFHEGGLDVTPLLEAVLEEPYFSAIASLAFMLQLDRSYDGQLTNAFATCMKNNLLNERINAWLEHAKERLSKRAGELIMALPAMQQMRQQYCAGATIGFWVEKGLRELHKKHVK